MLTTRVPAGGTPQPNVRKNGSVRETPADKGIEPGIGIGKELGIGTAGELGSGTAGELGSGTGGLGSDVPPNGAVDAGINFEVEVVPSRSIKSNSSPRMNTSWPALTTTTRRSPNGVPAGQPTNGTDSRVTSAASTVMRTDSSSVGAVGLSVAWLPLHADAATNAGTRKLRTQFERPAGIEHLAGRAEANGMRRSPVPESSSYPATRLRLVAGENGRQIAP